MKKIKDRRRSPSRPAGAPRRRADASDKGRVARPRARSAPIYRFFNSLLKVQRRRLRDEAGAIRIFEDVISGKSFDRPGLTQLVDFARTGDIVCVVRLDRLGRSLKELLETVDGFKTRRLAFRSLEEKLDTASAAGELVFHVFGAIAHFERRLIVERTRDGIAAARARGKRPGRPPLNQEKLASALTLIDAGVQPTQAAKQLGLGRSTLYREIAAAQTELSGTPFPTSTGEQD